MILWGQIWPENFYKWVILVPAGMQIIKVAGRKYKKGSKAEGKKEILPNEVDLVKAESAAIFKEKWNLAKTNQKYLQLSEKHRRLYE
jgi:hypothetical protein